jgi:FMN phosphatase YigB (HAD superfamily)/SAM-dependent methyltransferase
MTGRLVIFDVDDTLLDRAGRFRAWRDAFVMERGLPVKSAIAYLGRLDADGSTPRRRFFERAREHFGLADPVDELVAAYWADQLRRYHCPPETIAGLERLRRLGYRVGAATNGGPAQLDKLCVCGLDALIDGVGVSTLVGCAKPERGIFDVVAERAGAPLDGAWVVGDRANADIAGAFGIGARSVWMRRGRTWTETGFAPDFVADSVAEAVALILEAEAEERAHPGATRVAGQVSAPIPSHSWLPGVHPAPSIQGDPDLYEIECDALDPGQHLETAMRSVLDWRGRDVLDLGAGTGYHVPRFATDARHVYAVEPDDVSRIRAMERCARLGIRNASVLVGSAAQIPLRDASVDLVHARFAYFWGPGCEPGLAELQRVLRPGGAAFIIDHDLHSGQFAEWLRRTGGWPRDADEVDAFWWAHGYASGVVHSELRFTRRTDLERVVRLEFGAAAPDLLADHVGLRIEYDLAIYWRVFG